MHALSLLALALAPGTAIGIYIYLKDKHEREPLSLLLISFFYGTLSTIITLAISFPLTMLITTKTNVDVVNKFIEAVFKVALVEEFSKFVFVRFVLFNNKNFNEPFDGIVYAVMVSMGFATLENILYVFHSGFTTGVIRMFTAVPAHATFGALMGYFLGKAKFSYNRKLFFTIMALLTATAFHGSYDYFLFLGEVEGVWTGIWIGAMISLITSFILSRAAIRLHQQASPFITQQQNGPLVHDEHEVKDPEPPL